MRRVIVGLFASLCLLLTGPDPVESQVHWESPFMVAPNSPAGWGLYLVDPAPGSGIGVLSTWRGSAAPGGIGFRLGLAEGVRGELAVYGGFDASGFLLRRSQDFPMDLLWVTGAGASVGDRAFLAFPLGVSLGREFEADGVWFNPYASPRVVLDARFGDDDDDLDLDLAVDLGVDIGFDPGWTIRFAGTVGDRSALAIGMNFRVL